MLTVNKKYFMDCVNLLNGPTISWQVGRLPTRDAGLDCCCQWCGGVIPSEYQKWHHRFLVTLLYLGKNYMVEAVLTIELSLNYQNIAASHYDIISGAHKLHHC